jgi:hypothetical protein
MATAEVPGSSTPKAAAKGWRDVKDLPFAALFIANMIVVIGLSAAYVPQLEADFAEDAPRPESAAAGEVTAVASAAYRLLVPYLAFGAVFGAIWSWMWTVVVRNFTDSLVWVAIVMAPMVCLIILVSAAAVGVLTLVIIGGVGFVLTTGYACLLALDHKPSFEFARLLLARVSAVNTM